MKQNNNRKKYLKIDQNTGSENSFALLDGVESDLEDDIDELMNNSVAEFVFQKEDSEKDDVSNDQPKSILIPEANIHIIEDRGIQRIVKKRVKETELMSLKQKKSLKDSQKKRRKVRKKEG